MRSVTLLATLALLVGAACSGPAASPSPSQATPSASPEAEAYWLRMTTTQAIPPVNLFAVQPTLVITGDGVAVSQGPVPAIYPGPLLPNLLGRPVSEAGQAQIIQLARDLGLLDGATDFSGEDQMMGAVSGHIELTVDGRRVELTGNPGAQIVCVTTPCEPAPGSPEAFGEFWRRIMSLPETLAADIGPESPYVPPAYAILVGEPPEPEAGITPQIMDWPLDTPLATFGGPVANGTARCGRRWSRPTSSRSGSRTRRPVRRSG